MGGLVDDSHPPLDMDNGTAVSKTMLMRTLFGSTSPPAANYHTVHIWIGVGLHSRSLLHYKAGSG